MAEATTGDGDTTRRQDISYEALVDLCRNLESSHEGMRKQIELLWKENHILLTAAANRNYCYDDGSGSTSSNRRRRTNRRITTGEMTSKPGWNGLDGAYFCGHPYKNILQCMGHAVCVTRPDSGEIIYWNQAAENLFGYKSNELYKQNFTSLHVDEDYVLVSKKIMARLRHGGTWSGQFPLKKKTGEVFMALMTQSPLYEEEHCGGEFVGIITVTSDATVFNSQNSSSPKKKMNGNGNGQDDIGGAGGYRGVRGLNLRSIAWESRPQITSFVSDLVNLKKRGEDDDNNNTNTNIHHHDEDKDENGLENLEIKSERPPRIPVRKQIFQFSKSLIERRRVEEDDGVALKREPTMQFTHAH